MNYEIMDCIDAGSEYCPCHLAETGDCILCSQLSGKNFCDCINWKGVCIYQEYIWNGSKAKEERKNSLCSILEKTVIKDSVIILKCSTTHKLAKDLVYPGSFVFMRNPKFMQYYDAPISIMEANSEENYIKVAIELKGTKTRSINLLNEEEKVLIRGPFWNGVLGLKNIYKAKDGNSLLIIRGIGEAPALPVIKKLCANGNKLTILLDKRPFDKSLIEDYIKDLNIETIECSMIERGDITAGFKDLLQQKIDELNPNLIHISGPDLLSYKTIIGIDDKIPVSCCNNGRMCCGEGVCGSCTVKTNDHKLRRLCKLQTEPKFILRGRRKL